jgi:hypothetical protein
MLSHVFSYIAAIFDHWLASWGAVGLLVVAMIEKLHKPISKKWFIWAATSCALIAMFQAWNDEHTRADQLSSDKSALVGANNTLTKENGHLGDLLREKDKPIIVQAAPDPEVDKLLKRQDEELTNLKTQLPSPKKRALQVSTDILKFLGDRVKNQPTFFPTTGETGEDWRRQNDQFSQDYMKWMNETAAKYQVQFAIPIAEVLQDMKSEGIDISGVDICNVSNGNTFAIQKCGVGLGTLAEKLQH